MYVCMYVCTYVRASVRTYVRIKVSGLGVCMYADMLDSLSTDIDADSICDDGNDGDPGHDVDVDDDDDDDDGDDGTLNPKPQTLNSKL